MNNPQPLTVWSNHWYLPFIMEWRGMTNSQTSWITVPDGFADYRGLVDINTMFSSEPKGDPLDRTGTLKLPLRYAIPRPWERPASPISLEEALQSRVKEIESRDQRINLMWSGGIDSTALVNAFLTFGSDGKKLRILYSPFSQYEHPEYLELLRSRNIETVDISGTVYLDNYFDGVFVTGDAGDESHASIDQSFLEEFGYGVLSQPWRDFFWRRKPDQQFMDFCERYFKLPGMDIDSVLQARWWYYINSKAYCIWSAKLQFWSDYPDFTPDMLIPFYDCGPWERYIAHNLDRIMPEERYSSWKKDLRDFSLKHDNLRTYHETKKKTNSRQLWFYTLKKRTLKNLHALFILEDGTRVATANLPLFSKREYTAAYGDTLDYLWNERD